MHGRKYIKLTTHIHVYGGIRTRNPSNERLHTHALDRTATGTGKMLY